MRTYIERAQDFIEEISPYIGDWNDVYNISYDVDDFNKEKHRKVIMRHGIARIALITSDYVVKYDFDEEECEVVGGCENEVQLYSQAVKDGFDYLFAEITRYYHNGRNFYIMPRIRGINENNFYHADYYMTDEENRWCDDHNLSDLHCNNYGFRRGKVCIIDYACSLHETDGDSEYSTSSEVSSN